MSRARSEATLFGVVPAGPPMRIVRPPAEPAAAARHRYGHLSHAECVLLHEMLKSVGADGRDEVMAGLLGHMARAERSRARARTARRRERDGG